MRCAEMLPYIRVYMLLYIRACMFPYIRMHIRMHIDATYACTFKVRAYLIEVGASRSCGHARLACHLVI